MLEPYGIFCWCVYFCYVLQDTARHDDYNANADGQVVQDWYSDGQEDGTQDSNDNNNTNEIKTGDFNDFGNW